MQKALVGFVVTSLSRPPTARGATANFQLRVPIAALGIPCRLSRSALTPN
jgi:hypothetical protein